MRRVIPLLVAVCLCAALHAAEPPRLKKRIAILEFEDKTDGSVAWWRGGQTVGQGMSDMLLTALVKSGQYVVVEREKIQQVMTEQSLGASGAFTEQSAAGIGKLLGVEIAVFGAVTEFGYKEEERGGRAPIRTPFGRRSIGISVSTATARVTVDVRLVNTSTGQILAAESVAGSEVDRGVSVGGPRGAFKNQTEFDESMVGKAARKAMDSVVVKIGGHMKRVPWAGSVVKSEGSTVIVNAGSATGVAAGDTLVVYAKGEELIDPESGASLGSKETRSGRLLVVTDLAEGKAAECTVIEGSGGQRGDIVRYP
jgi:curli biogenesis system outer membrane secretion channel CsgG